MLMNVQLHNVITDITGKTGMQIVRDIASGATDPKALACHRDYRCRASEEEIAASLTGNYRPEHIFVLRQNLELYDSYQRQIQTCDGEIDTLLQKSGSEARPPQSQRSLRRVGRHRLQKNDPRFEIRSPLHRLSGADITQIDALGPYTALRLISEIGTDMTCWPTEKALHVLAYARAQGTKSPGAGSSARRHSPPRTVPPPCYACAPCQSGRPPRPSARTIAASPIRIGKPKAITATARKLAILVYRVLAKATSTTPIPVPTPTRRSIARAHCATCATAHNGWAWA